MWYLTYAEYPDGVFRSQVIDVCRHLSSIRKRPVVLVSLLSVRHYWQGRRIIHGLYRNSIVLPAVPKMRWWALNILLLLPFLLFARKPHCVCRGPFATLLAIMGRKIGLVCRVVYDGRGAVAAELREYDVISDETVVAGMRNWERRAVCESDYRNAVSTRLVDYWRQEYDYQGDRHVVLPCTVNSIFERVARRAAGILEVGNQNRGRTYVYSGSVAGWQSINRICAVLDKILSAEAKARAVFYCREHDDIENLSVRYPERVERRWVHPDEVPDRLAEADVGMLVRKDTVTNQVAAPTKFAEYLACGLKVIISENLGDYSDFVRSYGCGAVVSESGVDVEELTRKLSTHSDSAALCRRYFSKESDQMEAAYRQLVGFLDLEKEGENT